MRIMGGHMAIDILLIDDDPDMAFILRRFLGGTDFQIRAAISGEEGIQACRNQEPDVVLLDLMIPDLDGWQVCAQIRNFSSVPILILSVLGSPGHVARALEAGADDYLIKPVHAGMLASRLRFLVRKSLLSPSLSTRSSVE
jgi:DNA-binding response OmpR family regulator